MENNIKKARNNAIPFLLIAHVSSLLIFSSSFWAQKNARNGKIIHILTVKGLHELYIIL